MHMGENATSNKSFMGVHYGIYKTKLSLPMKQTKK